MTGSNGYEDEHLGFPFVEIAIGGASKRNRVIRADQLPALLSSLNGTADCYATPLRFPNEFAAHVEGTGSVKRYEGPALADFAYLDFDCEEDPSVALEEVRRFVLTIERVYDIPAKSLRIYFSGMKGFTVLIPASLFGGFEPSAGVSRQIGCLAKKLVAGLGTVDHGIYNLTRLLRLPNTRHSKTGLFKIPLAIEELLTLSIDAIKELAKSPREIDQPDLEDWEERPDLVALWRETAGAPHSEVTSTGRHDERDLPPTDVAAIVTACSWLAHTRGDAATLPEPEWHAMLSIIGRCEGGDQVAHEWSSPHPTYSRQETERKLRHALNDAGPATCRRIREQLGGEPYCASCPSWERIKSPIVLGRRQSVEDSPAGSDNEPKRAEKAHIHRTDLGNSRRLVRVHGDDLRYSPPLNYWFAWDDRRWRRDESEAVMRAARDVVSEIFEEAAKIAARAGKAETEKEREKLGAQATSLLSWALKSESRQRLEATVALARSERKFVILPDHLDRDPLLLNVSNGTVDLRTGELHPHRWEDFITKLAPVEYNRGARSGAWEQFLDRTIPDPDGRRFAQKAAGYTLTGETGEDVLLSIYGPTRSGKGTFQDALGSVLGDYALTAELELLAEAKRQDGSRPRPELVRLRGARMVSIYETSSRLHLSASLVKSLVGSDPITARDLYGKPVTFRPQFTLWIATNYRPRVPADDDALWERIRELPFPKTIPEKERDPELRRLLRTDPEHRSAILAWAVQGYLLLRQEGLGRPEVVRRATEAYREEMDPLRQFVEECCVLSPSAWTKSSDLRTRYEAWAKESGEKAIEGEEFRRALRARGCEPEHLHNGRGWKGIGFRDEQEGVTP